LRVPTTGTTLRAKGQALVEFVIVVPLLMLLLLGAIDFGRGFLGWLTINNMARVGANYAAMNPDGWPTNPIKQATYASLIAANSGTLNCTLDNPNPIPFFGASRNPGDLVRVEIDCYFTVATPLMDIVVGSPLKLSASSTFPITGGCIANCGAGPAIPPAPGTTDDGCRTAPFLVGLSVDGARAAWLTAGFQSANFSPATGDETRTVAAQSITRAAGSPTCLSGKHFFLASVSVTLEPVTPPPPGATCRTVPNLAGSRVDTARGYWGGAGFVGVFTPATGSDDRIVLGQQSDPLSSPGDCREPDTTMQVTHGPPPAPPPPAPCKVPVLVQTNTAGSTAVWTAAGFTAANLSFEDRLEFDIKSQSLVGNTYISCSAKMAVSKNPNVRPPP